MKKFEIIVGSIFISGSIMKTLHIPGGSTLVGFSSMLLFLLYFFFSFFLLNQKRFKDIFKRSTYSEIGVYRTIMSIIIGWTFFAFVAGVSFIILEFPGGNFFLYYGLILLFFCGVILLFGMQRHKEFVVICYMHIFFVMCIGFIVLFSGFERYGQ